MSYAPTLVIFCVIGLFIITAANQLARNTASMCNSNVCPLMFFVLIPAFLGPYIFFSLVLYRSFECPHTSRKHGIRAYQMEPGCGPDQQRRQIPVVQVKPEVGAQVCGVLWSDATRQLALQHVQPFYTPDRHPTSAMQELSRES